MEYGSVVERQWPFDATPLELLAHRAGLDADEVREWLRSEIMKQSSCEEGVR